jgi:hypothetical protein
MPLQPCSSCGQRSTSKLSTVYWAWNLADHSRRAYRQRLCITCYCMSVAPLSGEQDMEHLACPLCHVGTDDDMDPVYATVFVPGTPKFRIESPTCAPCAVEVRNRAMQGADDLEDRQQLGVGAETSAPTYTAADAWASIGVVPR